MWLSNQQSRIIRRTSAATLPTIAGLALWLKADAITGLSDADAIATWTDSSGNGRNATQGTAGARPTYKTGIIGGKPVARFDGGDLLLAADFADAAHTAFVVMATTSSDLKILLSHWDSTGNQRAWALLLSEFAFGGATNKMQISLSADGATSANRSEGSTVVNSGAGQIVASKFASGAYAMHVNGAPQTLTALTGSVPATLHNSTAQIAIGGLWSGGSWIGDIAEIIIYDSALSDANRQAVEAYLSAKYGIALT